MIGKIVKVRINTDMLVPALVVGIVEDEGKEIKCARIQFFGSDRDHIYDIRDLEIINET